MEFLLIAAVLFLAFSNGANDNFKGFATVWGSETLSYRGALTLATAATLAGSLISLVLASALAQQFSGKGLVPQAVVGHPDFILSVAIGAAATVFIATRFGLPISTTHALIGGLVGAGLGQVGGEVYFSKLSSSFLLPLLASPLLAAMLGLLAYRLFGRRSIQNDCVCVVEPEIQLAGVVTRDAVIPAIIVAPTVDCEKFVAPLGRWSLSRMGDRLHIGSAALICFARGVNDTPKLVALLLSAQLLDASLSILLIAIIMAAGGVLYARRVAVTMSKRVTCMDPRQGLTANLITAGLVLFASKMGFPVSTTHVSVGSIAGVGFGANGVDRATVRNILLSWVATLPLAAALAWIVS
jgi:PiT family inorganic phosphate transporter